MAIGFAAVNSGLQTYPFWNGSTQAKVIELITLWVLFFEVTVKLIAESCTCKSYHQWFMDIWNSFGA